MTMFSSNGDFLFATSENHTVFTGNFDGDSRLSNLRSWRSAS